MAVKAALQLLVLAVCRNNGHAEVDTYTSHFARNIEQFKALLAYIDRNYAEHLKVDEAAHMVGLSPAHFCRTFKNPTGRTLVEFINLTRVDKAAALLNETVLPVSGIFPKYKVL